MTGLIDNKIRDAGVVQSRLNTLTVSDVILIGQSFSISIASRMNAEAGVDEWVIQFPSMVELMRTDPWMLSLVTTIAKRKLVQAPWGLGK